MVGDYMARINPNFDKCNIEILTVHSGRGPERNGRKTSRERKAPRRANR